MARRSGRKGEYLMADDYTGFTEYAGVLKQDYWGNYAKRPLQRNLQEVASPLLDPLPVYIYRGPQYEQTTPCQFELQPEFIGLTHIPTPNSYASQVLGLNPSIPDMSVGCTFIVR